MSFTLRHIRYFVAVAENGKVSIAATAVGISPSSVSTAIQELEDQLGVSLFDRHRRGLKLTYEGNRFLQHSHNILDAVSAAGHALNQRQTDFSGKLSIGVTITIAGYFLAPLLAHFKRSFPKIDVHITEYSRTVIERKLIDGELDIALVITSNISNTNVIAYETLVRSSRQLWVAPNHPVLELDQVTLKNVSELPYIQLMIDEAQTTHYGFWEKAGVSPNTVFETGSVEAMRSLVATGAGVTILSDMVYRPWTLEGNRIELVTLADEIPSMNVGLAWHKATPINETANAFLEYCRLEYVSGRRSFRSGLSNSE
jgi:DNA-binding transcriptional LysR family regulator